MSTPPLPAGYALDSKPQSAPPLPPGYALDSSAQIPDAMAQSAAQTRSVVKGVAQGMAPSFFGGAHPDQPGEQIINTARPQIQGRVSDIRKAALQAGGAAFGGEAAQLAKGLPWLARTMAGASGAGAGAGAGTLAGGGSPKEALETAGQFAATSAPLAGLAEGAQGARGAISKLAYDSTGDPKSAVSAVGDALEHPASIPGKLVRRAASKLFPPPPTYPGASLPSVDDFYQARGTDLMRRGAQEDILARRAARNLPWETPVEKNPGASLPSSGEFYENKGTDLLNRQKAQDLLDKQAARTAKANAPVPQKPNPWAGMTSSDKPIGNAAVPPPGTYSLPKIAPLPPSPVEVPSAEGVPGSIPKPSGRLVVLPQEAQALDQMQRIAKTRASQHGLLYAAGMRPAGGGRVPRSPTAINTTEFSGIRPEAPQGNPTPFSPALKTETDNLGIRWAVSPEGYRVSIPKSVPPEALEAYALPKLAEQAQIHSLPWMKKSNP